MMYTMARYAEQIIYLFKFLHHTHILPRFSILQVHSILYNTYFLHICGLKGENILFCVSYAEHRILNLFNIIARNIYTLTCLFNKDGHDLI